MVLVLANVASRGVTFLATMYLVRYLSVADFGTFNFVFAFTSFFGILSTSSGVVPVLTREIIRNPEREKVLLGSGFVVQSVTAVGALVLATACAFLLGYSVQTVFLVLLASTAFLWFVFSVPGVVFYIEQKLGHIAASSLIGNVACALLVLALVARRGSLPSFVIATSFGVLLTNLYLLWKVGRERYARLTIDRQVVALLVRETWPLLVGAICVQIYQRIDQVLLYSIKGGAAIGYYAAATKLTEILNIVPVALMSTLYPLLADYHANAPEKYEHYYRLSLRIMGLLAVTAALPFIIFARPIITFCFTRNYSAAVPVLQILAVSVVWRFVEVTYSYILLIAGQQKASTAFQALNAVVNLLMNLVLIPRYGIIGAATATAISYGVGQFACAAHSPTREVGVATIVALVRPILAGSLAILIMHVVPLPFALTVVVSPAVYLACLWLVGELRGHNLRLYRELSARITGI